MKRGEFRKKLKQVIGVTITTWALTVGFKLGDALLSTGQFCPYEFCKQAGEKYIPIVPQRVATATPIGCPPEYHGSDKVVDPAQGFADFQRHIIDLLRWSTASLQG